MAIERMTTEPPLESTAALLALIRDGDEGARERLVRRFLPVLRRWAHGRLPPPTRGMLDTDDLVQVTLIRALNHVGEFEARHEGAFLAYLRQIVLNQVRDEVRRAIRRPVHEPVDDTIPAHAPSPVEAAVGREALERYERALGRLTRDQQQAVLLRVEFGFSYAQISEALGRPSANAARKLVTRALFLLARSFDE